MKTYDSMDVANHIINRAIDKKRQIGNYKLHSIMYYTFLEYFRRENKRLFNDKFIACNFGIAIQKPYKTYMETNLWTDLGKLDTTIQKLSIDDYIDALFSLYCFDLKVTNEYPYTQHYKEHKEAIIPIKAIEAEALSPRAELKYNLFTLKHKIRTLEKNITEYTKVVFDTERAIINLKNYNNAVDMLLYGKIATTTTLSHSGQY